METTEKMLELQQNEAKIVQRRAEFLTLAQNICQLKKAIQDMELKTRTAQKELEKARDNHIHLAGEQTVLQKQLEIFRNRVLNKTDLLKQQEQMLEAAQEHVWCEYRAAICDIQEWIKSKNTPDKNVYQEREFLATQMALQAQKQEEAAQRKLQLQMTAEIEVMVKFKSFQERKILALSKYLVANTQNY